MMSALYLPDGWQPEIGCPYLERTLMPYGIGLIGNRAHQNTFGPILHNRPDCQIVAAAEHLAAKGTPLEQAYGVRCVRRRTHCVARARLSPPIARNSVCFGGRRELCEHG